MTDPLEFRYLWNAAEHRRFYSVLQNAVMRRGRMRWMYLLLFAVVVVTIAAEFAKDGGTPLVMAFKIAPYVIVILAWLALMRWGMPHLSARTYARNHQACIPHDQVRVVSDEGIQARCMTSDVKIQWSDISRLLETPEFFSSRHLNAPFRCRSAQSRSPSSSKPCGS